MKSENLSVLEKYNFKQFSYVYVGKINEYYLEVVDVQDSEYSLNVSFYFYQNDNKSKLFGYFDELQKNGIISNYEMQKDEIYVTYNENCNEDFESFLQNLTKQLADIQMKNKCCNCDNTNNLAYYYNEQRYMFLCDDCANDLISKIEEDKNSPGNYVVGFVGSLIGALVGSLAWIIIGALGFIASIAGAAISFCAFKGYELAKGKLSKTGIIINIVSIVIAFLFAQYIGIFFDFKHAIPEANFTDYLLYTPVLFSDVEFLLKGLLPNFGLGILFVVLGASSSVSNNLKTAKHNDSLKIEKLSL